MILWIFLCYFIHFTVAYKSLALKPGGLKGFYMMGITKYIKSNYDLENWHFYGSSAGAWNSLYLSCKKDELFLQHAQELEQFNYLDLYDLECTMKKRILSNFVVDDFNINQLHICVSKKRKYIPFPLFRKNIINEFYDLEDIIECCIASSHLPYVSNGKFYYNYRGNKCVDGGFFFNPYNDFVSPTFMIEPDMWNNQKTNKMNKIHNMNIKGLLYEGYNDAYQNRNQLDHYFL